MCSFFGANVVFVVIFVFVFLCVCVFFLCVFFFGGGGGRGGRVVSHLLSSYSPDSFSISLYLGMEYWAKAPHTGSDAKHRVIRASS